MSSRKVIVTVAPTGGRMSKADNPHLPTQPDEIAEQVAECAEAGAAMTALHARLPDDRATCDPEIYAEINRQIRERCDVVISNSTGGGSTGDMVKVLEDGRKAVDFEKRISATLGGADMCEVDAQMHFANYDVDDEVIIDASWSRAVRLAEAVQRNGIKPKWTLLSPTDLAVVMRLIEMGYDEPPYHFGFAFSNVYSGATPYTPRHMQRFIEDLPENSLFTVEGSDIRAVVHSVIAGGHVRVGLEDSIWYRPGEPATNLQLVDRIVRIIGELGMEPATPDEARQMLGMK